MSSIEKISELKTNRSNDQISNISKQNEVDLNNLDFTINLKNKKRKI
jgi:hypothetical protein